MKRIFTLCMTLAAVVGFLACSESEDPTSWQQPPSGAQAGDYSVESCVHTAREVEYVAECGILIVPENRNDEKSRVISLPVKRIRASSDTPLEPIFYLTGGPGESNMDYSRVAWFHENHDIVLVGYRGVDGSVVLNCPEVSEAFSSGIPLLSSEGMAAQANAYSVCADRLQADGVELAGYTVLEVVDDIEAARQALGYSSINLESGSYGTRLAQIYSWRYPDHVHRNAMVAVNPPGRFWWDPAILHEQILRYSTLCAEDEYCSSRTDDLAASIQKALDAMPERWLIFPVDRDAVLIATFIGLYSTDGAALTFDIWLAAAEGDYSGMALVTAALKYMVPAGYTWGDNASKACSADYDYDPTVDYIAQATPEPYLIGSPGSAMGWAAAAGWPVSKIPDEYRSAQPSAVETLMLSGTLDVSTPAQNARDQLLPLLENGEQVVLSGFAHTGDLIYHQREATRHLLSTFFTTGRVDASLFESNRVNFKASWGFPLIAKLVLAGGTLAMVVLLLVCRYVFRLVRRKIRFNTGNASA
ncbi:MAG: alpha/beta hydrolase [bacterium]|nr:alpha/beta hydrolase [bacterium]